MLIMIALADLSVIPRFGKKPIAMLISMKKWKVVLKISLLSVLQPWKIAQLVKFLILRLLRLTALPNYMSPVYLYSVAPVSEHIENYPYSVAPVVEHAHS